MLRAAPFSSARPPLVEGSTFTIFSRTAVISIRFWLIMRSQVVISRPAQSGDLRYPVRVENVGICHVSGVRGRLWKTAPRPPAQLMWLRTPARILSSPERQRRRRNEPGPRELMLLRAEP